MFVEKLRQSSFLPFNKIRKSRRKMYDKRRRTNLRLNLDESIAVIARVRLVVMLGGIANAQKYLCCSSVYQIALVCLLILDSRLELHVSVY